MGTKTKANAGRKQAPERPSREAGGQRPGRKRSAPAEVLGALVPDEVAQMAVEAPHASSSASEPDVVTRVPPVVPGRPWPARRRAIFLDVENTSKPQHLAHVIDHLAVDRRDSRTELVGVANWRVVGHDSARLLAQRGAAHRLSA